MPNELKPCPFCGGNAAVLMVKKSRFTKNVFFYVKCRVCRASTSVECTKEEATEKWEMRADNG